MITDASQHDGPGIPSNMVNTTGGAKANEDIFGGAKSLDDMKKQMGGNNKVNAAPTNGGIPGQQQYMNMTEDS